ncbi:TetR/AcrR family transcriptional regulator [Rhodococcus sp. G-MC3]|uniref:TetR/AcrR family transcriptional regulator n=1 Tax=Rhodococcus sp. G-MC3 TaxID=3046209 RepID=UPI0024B88B37|nr:TetR/AcrR family transcriptional regulator [Rhodococcus sp. G-MC3]MDJ0395711.1 TetR/AcrR family transcriptional regulator [Rhodococcus sp. G-MC3]
MVNKTGRARDTTIDDRVLAVAARYLAESGYDAMSVHRVAADAGTTRQSIYRRWPSKAALAEAAVNTVTEVTPAELHNEEPFDALVRELITFESGVSRPGRMALVGTMLQEGTAADVRDRYRANVVAPRRQRIRAIFERAQRAGCIPLDADLEIVVPMVTGSFYGRALAGDPIPRHWPQRTAALVWRAAGGTLGSSAPQN